MKFFSNLYRSQLSEGYATHQGTLRYFTERVQNETYRSEFWYHRPLALDLFVSRLGFGCYRISRENDEHRSALRDALISGTNLIDTSANYTDGTSEALIGDVLAQMFEANRIQRDELVIVTKAGYIQGCNMEFLNSRKELYQDTVPYAKNLYHCIHPDFLIDQIDFSRKRLGLQTIDIFLLHNPEYYLMFAQKKGVAKDEARHEYYRRLQLAFGFLETLVSSGKIRSYGISSNTFPLPDDDYTSTSLTKVLTLGGPHFSTVQFPGNILESGNEKFIRLVHQAKKASLLTLFNRPLNAITANNSLIRLAQHEQTQEDIPNLMQLLTEDIKNTEEILVSLHQNRHFQFDDRCHSLSSILATYKDTFSNEEHFVQNIPSLTKMLQKSINLLHSFTEQEQQRYALERYMREINRAFALWQKYTNYKYVELTKPLQNELASLSPELVDQPLACQSILTLLALHGTQSVLVGMRRVEYTRQLQQIYRSPRPDESLFFPISRATLNFYNIDK